MKSDLSERSETLAPFEAVARAVATDPGGLPGAGWDKSAKTEVEGALDGSKAVFKSADGKVNGTAAGGQLTGTDAAGKAFKLIKDALARWAPEITKDAATVKDYTERVGIPYLAVPDPSEKLANDFRILGIPTHYFIDADGILREMKIGSLTPDAMDAALKEIGG